MWTGSKVVDVFYENYRGNFLSAFQKSADTADGHRIYIGGGSGFATKTAVYTLYRDKNRAVQAVQKIMINTTSTKKEHDPHKHSADARKYRISPHMRKCPEYRSAYYDFGPRNLILKSIGKYGIIKDMENKQRNGRTAPSCTNGVCGGVYAPAA